MKKLICLFLSVVAILSILNCALAESVSFDPSQYSNEELIEIINIIHKYLPITPEGTVVYDDDELYVEYRGICKGALTDWTIALLIKNKTDEPTYFRHFTFYVNDCLISFRAHDFLELPPHKSVLTSTLFNPRFRLEDLRAYGIDIVHNIEVEIAGKTVRIENLDWKLPDEE